MIGGVNVDQVMSDTTEKLALCPKFEETFVILGKKWNGLIVELLLKENVLRFKDFVAGIGKCSDRVLVERLRELESEGIVTRNTHPGSVSKVDYSLTGKGLALKPVMEAVHNWGDEWID